LPRCLPGRHGGAVPASRPGTAKGRLHRGTTRSTAIGASTSMHTLTVVSSKKHGRRQGRGRRGIEIGGDRDAETRAGSHHGSPRRGGSQRNGLVEIEEDARASVSPKVATAMVAGVGQNGQATVATIQIASELERKTRERVRAGLGRLTDPDPSRLA
jgi:hypothetical protein